MAVIYGMPQKENLPFTEDLSHREQLKMAVEHTHRCRATWVETVQVRERFPGGIVWEGDVTVFAIEHGEAKVCYAWSEVSGRRDSGDRFVTALAVAPVDSAVSAVRSIVVRD